MRSWVIGSSPDCDVVVDSPLASARHCQLTQTPEGFLLNDLGSTNGTYVNGVRIAGPIRLTTGDSITLGRTVPFPWPPELTTSIRIGRLADNDIVLDDPRVSGHHARLIVVAGFQTSIEDIGSSNGTFLNSPDRRVTSPTPHHRVGYALFWNARRARGSTSGRTRKPEPAAPVPPLPPQSLSTETRANRALPATGHLARTSLASGLAGPGAGLRGSDRFDSRSVRSARRTGNRSGKASPPRRSPSRWRRSGWAAPCRRRSRGRTIGAFLIGKRLCHSRLRFVRWRARCCWRSFTGGAG